MKKRKSILVFISVIILASIAAVFIIPPPQEKIVVPVLQKEFTAPDLWFNRFNAWRLGLDLVGGSALVYEINLDQVKESDYESVVGGLRDVIERRVNKFGVAEPKVTTAQKGKSYELIIELPGIKNVEEAIAQIGSTPLLDFREVQGEGDEAVFALTELTGRYIKNAQVDLDQVTRKPLILLEFDEEGAKFFEEITTRNIGKPLGVFLDGELIQAPTVNEAIPGGSAQITGDFSIDEARLIVERFNAGALSAPINLVNQRTVSATAASDALEKMIFAGVVGTLLVMLFMVIYYRGLGFFAVVALFFYVILTLGAFKSIPNFTMTLAGIAGFILSIGMAVDANILIFARTKEELAKGITKLSAIEEGFRRAWPSIRDSNTTTIISSIILYYFTSSFVRGFALTLLIGVVVSMFSAIFVTRTLLRVFMKNKPMQKLS
ncbi:MAG: protein-export membrane protein SecD [Candidatus Colwellbacteria bacterium RIFCSPLOWO2_12_FULL_44_13]|uniref:Protein translocase subunit SecD n=3 Tax=Candidatus Colwelliibacteriota TaxID=1817904 RepID=A0A1G1Z5A1_9BACT|nr:MAG: protein-export membrane protein SecD [Candidatus Colwellbacteria bacterium RIFCSPHIGHO2_12_FULL_44_17]OGY59821.1 MAG: protein-export membrane protein SecD [Candidatus Colwellbacteria bacterium RIFCSPLOWO2_02_FULL_44_20b]OGY61546.1 MAG: protein-export membrane protein SecD [Candidatus Colwellbacteria bacterium RIFCSPLOWO2_12_FULL_44_13]